MRGFDPWSTLRCPDTAADVLLRVEADGTPFIQRPAELLNRYAGTQPGGQPSEQELLAVLVSLEHAVDAAPHDLRPALHDVATPLRRFLVAHRSGEVFTVNTEAMIPAVSAIFAWANANGYKVKQP